MRLLTTGTTRVREHIRLCWRAVLPIRSAETAPGHIQGSLREELDRMYLGVSFDNGDGRLAAQRSAFYKSPDGCS